MWDFYNRIEAIRVVMVVLATLPALACSQEGAVEVAPATAFIHVTVIDGTGEPPQENMTVVISGDRIAEVGKTSAVNLPENAVVIDAAGKFLIPGLWDMHVHLTKAGESALPLFVVNGVTSVRDMGGDFAAIQRWRQAIEAGAQVGPRIKAPGPILESAVQIERMKQRGVAEPVDRTRVGIPNPESARASVESVAAMGVDFLKIRTFASHETYFAIAEAARNAGLPLAGHAVGLTPENVLDASQRSIEHFLYPLLNRRTEEDRKAIFEAFAANGVAMVPTLVVGLESTLVPYERAKTIFEDHEGAVEERRKYVSQLLLADWQEQLAEKKEPSGINLEGMLTSIVRDLREMHKAGVSIMPGTDTATILIYPGFSLHDELAYLVDNVGMSPMDVLINATRRPAEFFHMADSLGTIAAGKKADLVLLTADPLADIRNTRRIAGVVLNGEFHARPDLDDMLRGIANEVQTH